MLAMDADTELLVGFKPGDRIGNLCREVRTFLAPMMDNNFGSDLCIEDNDVYEEGFDLRCILSYSDFNHTKLGYSLEIVISTTNSIAWVEELYVEINKYVESDFITRL